MYQIYRDAPDRYKTTHLDISNEKIPEKLFESEHETSPQNLPEPLPKNIFEPLQTQDLSEIPTKPASIQKLLLIDDGVQNHLTINKKNRYTNASSINQPDTKKQTPYVLLPDGF